MTQLRWNGSFKRFGSGVLLAAACVVLRGEPADACGWGGPVIEDLTTFDPRVLDDAGDAGLYYDPFTSGWGNPCSDCARAAMLEDWQGYLGDAVTSADWSAVLLDASEAELAAIHASLGTTGPGKAGSGVAAKYAASSLWKDAKARPKLRAAVAVVQLARQVEAVSAESDGRADGVDAKARAAALRKTQEKAKALLGQAQAGMKSRDAFLAQRYGFLQLRLSFYQRRWAEVIAAFDKGGALLAGPSQDLAWRARYYAAGALMRTGQRARGNLELARVHAGYSPLAGVAANDFRPMEEGDWRESLRLARTPKEKAELWRLVGITRDGVVAMQEIAKLDASSPLLAMLMVREVERAESRTDELWGSLSDKGKEQARRELATLEQLAAQLAAAPGADRGWLMSLVAGHLAAWRGDLVAAKRGLLAALAGRPGDARVKHQVHASLAMALVREGTAARSGGALRLPTVARGNEAAAELAQVPEEFGRQLRLHGQVRGDLAAAYAAAGKLIEAELLQPGLLMQSPQTAGKWQDAGFLRGMIARVAQARASAAPFEKLLRGDAQAQARLELELAMLHLTRGAFGEAAKALSALGGDGEWAKLGTDPFKMRIVDCHDCDHELYGHAAWTHASMVKRMAELERRASGKDEAAAAAALELGNALYNITWYGNARVVLDGTHQTIESPQLAERWYRRAYELTRNRELRAKAAFFAAKAELGTLITAAQEAGGGGPYVYLSELPVPARWFPALERLEDTRYYKEVIAECGHFAAWAANRKN